MQLLPFDLADYRKRFPDVLQDRYQSTFAEGFRGIRSHFLPIQKGERDLTVDDVLAIFDTSLPHVRHWTMPDSYDLAKRMRRHKVAAQIRRLQAPGCDYDEDAVLRIWICFRELGLTSLVLQHIYPDRFAMCSHHLASLLCIGSPTVPEFYIRYCKELGAWAGHRWPTRARLNVEDAEYALWTWYRLARFGDASAQELHRRCFDLDPWIRKRRADRLAEGLGKQGRLQLARYYLASDHTAAAILAGCEMEIIVRAAVQSRGMAVTGKTKMPELLDHLERGKLSRHLSRQYLDDLWEQRNAAVHGTRRLTVADAESLLGGVDELARLL